MNLKKRVYIAVVLITATTITKLDYSEKFQLKDGRILPRNLVILTIAAGILFRETHL
jgi:hypothetical protein